MYDDVRFDSSECVNTELWCEAPSWQQPEEKLFCSWDGICFQSPGSQLSGTGSWSDKG